MSADGPAGPREPARGDELHPAPPSDAGELARFPQIAVTGRWFRAHVHRAGARDGGCWHFSSNIPAHPAAAGRFDLTAPRGTCYLGSTPEVAARERLGSLLRKRRGDESVTAAALSTAAGPVVISAVAVSVPHAANLAVKAAGRWINRSLWAGAGVYAISQAWADRFDEAGLDGVRYPPRFTLGTNARSLGVFGPSGTPVPPHAVAGHEPLDAVLSRIGIRVVAVPHRASDVIEARTLPPPL